MKVKRANSDASSHLAKREEFLYSEKMEQKDLAPYRVPILSVNLNVYELRDSCEFSLSEEKNKLTLTCGERFDPKPEYSMFVFQLMRLNQETGKVTIIEFGMESYHLLKKRAEVISTLLGTCEKALIFQTDDVQLYLMEEDPAQGFLAHFEDRRRVKISLTAEEFERWNEVCKERIEKLHRIFVRRTNSRMRMRKGERLEISKPTPSQ